MLGAGPPRDGIIRTSPGQECSKDKGALPGARRISVYAFRFWSRARHIPSRWFTSRCLILCLVAERVSLYPAKRRCARSSMDRASDYGSEGWGFESLRARSGPPRCDPPVGVLHFFQALLRECFFMPIHKRSSHSCRGYRTKRVGFVATFRLAGAGKSTLKLVVSSWGYEYPQMSGVRASDDQVWALSVRGAAMALLPVQYQPGQPH